MHTQDDWPDHPMMSVSDLVKRLPGMKHETVYRAIRRSQAEGYPIGYQSGGVWLIYTDEARVFKHRAERSTAPKKTGER